MSDPIKPLFEDPGASAELRDFIALARNDGANQADLDRLARRVGPVVGVSAALVASSAAAIGASAPLAAASGFGAPASGLTAALGSSAAANAVGGAAKAGALKAGAGAVHAGAVKAGLFSQLMATTSAKLLALGLSLGAAGAAVYGVGSSDSERPPPGPAVAAPAKPRAAQPKPVPAHEEPARVQASAAEPAAQVEPLVVEPAREPRAPSSPVLRARKSPPAPHATAPAPVAAAPTPELKPAETAIVDDPSAAAQAKRALPPPSELSLIERAEALRTQPNEGLAFLSKHEEVYPRGALVQEREVLAIELLLKAGRLSQAAARAERFEDAHPRSAHLPHVHALLARARGE